MNLALIGFLCILGIQYILGNQWLSIGMLSIPNALPYMYRREWKRMIKIYNIKLPRTFILSFLIVLSYLHKDPQTM